MQPRTGGYVPDASRHLPGLCLKPSACPFLPLPKVPPERSPGRPPPCHSEALSMQQWSCCFQQDQALLVIPPGLELLPAVPTTLCKDASRATLVLWGLQWYGHISFLHWTQGRGVRARLWWRPGWYTQSPCQIKPQDSPAIPGPLCELRPLAETMASVSRSGIPALSSNPFSPSRRHLE